MYFGKFIISLSIVIGVLHSNYYPLVVIGGGVSGYSAAIYGGNARIPTAVFVGPRPGGQLAVAGIVENMPSVEPQHGMFITEKLEAQAQDFGATIINETIVSVEVQEEGLQPNGSRFKLVASNGDIFYADALVVATGSRPKTLNVPGESEFWNQGVSSCALCDAVGADDKDVVVVGGGDSAIEEALQLLSYARTITILVRGDSLKASPRMQEKLVRCDRVRYRFNVQVQEIIGNSEHMTGVKVFNKETGQEELISAECLFLAIGHIPETDFIKDIISCDEQGFINLQGQQKTSIEGIFAAGDVTDRRYRQAIVASGDGAKAALDAIAYLRGID